MDALHVMEPEDTGKCIEHAGYVDAVTISDMEGLRSMKERLDEQRLSGKGVINLSQLSTGTSSQSNGGFNNTTIVQDLRNMNMNSQLNNPPDGIHVSGFDTAGGDGMNQNQDQMQDFQPSMLDANGNNLLDFDIEMSDDMFWEGIMAGWPTGLDHSSGGGAMMF